MHVDVAQHEVRVRMLEQESWSATLCGIFHRGTARLQRDLTAEVIVLSVCENTEACQTGVSLETIKTRLAQSDLSAYRFLSGQGLPSTEIAAVAAANEVDLVVMGHYRHAAPVEWLVGSTVDRLLRATSLPVLIA